MRACHPGRRGRGAGLFDVAVLVPFIGGLRAIGRMQAMVLLFSIPAVLLLIEHWRARWLVAAVCLLELMPRGRTPRVTVEPEDAALTAALAGPPVLVLPFPDHRFMLSTARTEGSYFSGVASRAPPGQDYVDVLSRRRHAPLEELLALTGATRILAANTGGTPRTCLRDGRCLYDVAPPDGPLLRLDADTEPHVTWTANAALIVLRATKDGTLNAAALDRCKLVQELRLGPVPLRSAIPVQTTELLGVRFHEGDAVLRHTVRLALFRVKHPTLTLRAECAAPTARPGADPATSARSPAGP